MKESLSIVLVDPEHFVRKALVSFINSLEDYLVVADVCNIDDGLERIESLHPAVVITELQFPSKNGAEFARQIRQRGLPTKIVILSRCLDAYALSLAIESGAHAFLPKHCSVEEFKQALLSLRGDSVYIPECVSKTWDKTQLATFKRGSDPISCLSSREREVFFLLANGHQNAAIAKQLFISPRTVETHRARIVRKLKIHTNADLIRYAIRNGLSSA